MQAAWLFKAHTQPFNPRLQLVGAQGKHWATSLFRSLTREKSPPGVAVGREGRAYTGGDGDKHFPN